VIVIGACVVVVGSFCVLNFLLTLGVIRKLRQHERALMRSPAPEEWIMPNDWRLAVGAPVPDFTATAITGETVSRADLTDKRAVIAFFSTDCESCRTQLNRFANHARKRSSEGWRVVAVVNGDLATAPEFVSALQGVVTTVVEPDQGPGINSVLDRRIPDYLRGRDRRDHSSLCWKCEASREYGNDER